MTEQKLFQTYPLLENDRIILRRMTDADADALQEFAGSEAVYRYLPTFLYEQKYEDAHEVIARMDEECFDTKESILLAICLKEEPSRLVGIAEIYNYEEKKEKASIGCRLSEAVWGQGIATQTIGLLKDYLIGEIGLRTITAHIMRVNGPSARAAMKNGFLCKYPNIYGDWGLPDLIQTDKYVFKRDWLDRIPAVEVDQYVMAYSVEQDRIRAMLPEGFESLRPVLRINVEIRHRNDAGGGSEAGSADVIYVEFNTPAAAGGRRGWLNIASWKTSSGDDLRLDRAGSAVTVSAPFLTITFTGTGITGGCPAEKDNEGCFFFSGEEMEFRPAEKIDSNKEFCDCDFAWRFREGDAGGASCGETLPAFAQEVETVYERLPLTARNAAAIPCGQVLGAYRVSFSRYGSK